MSPALNAEKGVRLSEERANAASSQAHSSFDLAAGDDPLDEAVRARDLDAVAALAWQRYSPALATYLRDRGVAGQDLDDVCADAFLSMLESWATFDGQPFRGWLYTLARHSLRSHARSRRESHLEPTGRTDWPDPSVTSPERAFDARVALATIQGTLASLSDPDRLIALCMALGETDIATVNRLRDELGVTMSAGTLASRRSRLRRVLANTLCARGLR